MAQLRVNDFSGGETDRFRDGKPNFAQTMKNLLISENKRLITRPGHSSLYTDLCPFGNQRIVMIWDHCTSRQGGGTVVPNVEYETFVISNGAVRVSSSANTGWRTVTADDGSVFLPANTEWLQDAQVDYTRINDNEFLISQHRDDGGTAIYPTKFYRESAGGDWRYVSLGLPKHKDILSTVRIGGIGSNNWLYAIVLKHTYSLTVPGSGTVTKIVRSTPVFSGETPDSNTVELDIPSFDSTTLIDFRDGDGGVLLSSRATFAYQDIVWEIYRTVDNGTVYYKLDEITRLGDSNYQDSETDANLIAGEKLYTTGGVLGNDMVPRRGLYSTFTNNTLWMASRTIVWQSKIGIPDAVPGSFQFTVQDGEEITALSHIDIYPIVFTNKSVYRIEGIVDDLGNGTHRQRTISETDGALSNKTTIKAGNQIFYWTRDGIYATNGYTTAKVSAHFNETYNEIISRIATVGGDPTPSYKLTVGGWDKEARRVHWVFTTDNNVFYPTETLTLDLKYRHEEGYCKTSGQIPYSTTSLDITNGDIHLSTTSGDVLTQSPNNFSDLVASNLEKQVINWEYVSCSLSFGSSLVRKWFTRILLNLTNRSDITFSVQSDTDESDDYRDHNPVKERGFTRGLYFLKRWFPKGRLRGTYKTIRIANDNQILFKSDDYDTATQTSPTSIVIDSGSWPTDLNYFYLLTLDADNYTTLYPISTFSATTITLISGSMPAGTHRWQILGRPPDEVIELNGYTIDYTPTGEGHTQSQTEGAANV